MKTNQQDDIIDYGVEWRIRDADHFLVTVPGGGTALVPNSHLDNRHPLLARSVRAYISSAKDSPYIHKALLNATREYLCSGGITLTGENGKTFTHCKVYRVDINSDPARPELIYLLGLQVKVVMSPDEVPYIVESHLSTKPVRDVELDAKYPGWRERLAFGRDLEMPTTELLDLVFTNSARPDLAAGLCKLNFE